MTGEIEKLKPKTLPNETVNGIAARVIEASDATGQLTMRVWLAAKDGYPIKIVSTVYNFSTNLDTAAWLELRSLHHRIYQTSDILRP